MFSKLPHMILMMVSTLMVSVSLYAVGGNVYLSTITDTTGALASRSLLEFHKDGTLVVSDSGQQGKADPNGFAPFGTQHGYWEKDDKTVIIKTVNFTYPKYFTVDWPTGFPNSDQQIGVLTATLRKGSDNRFAGQVFLSFFPLTSNINDPSQGSTPFLAGTIVLDRITKP